MTERIPAKHCTECGEYKALTEFYKKPKGGGGHLAACKECHRARTRRAREADGGATNRGNAERQRDRRIRFIAALKDRPCTDCGVKYPPYVMQFDHIPGRGKTFEVNAHDSLEKRKSEADILEEAKRCELVCANCHAERTWGPGRNPGPSSRV